MKLTIERADVLFAWFTFSSVGGKRAKHVLLTHKPTGVKVTGRGRTINEAQNNGLAELDRRVKRHCGDGERHG
jgi:hypothetical protein